MSTQILYHKDRLIYILSRHRPLVPDDFFHLAKHLDDNEHVLPAVHLLHSPITFVKKEHQNIIMTEL